MGDAGITGLWPVAEWERLYDRAWGSQSGHYAPLSRSADSFDHYNLAYGVDGATAMFEATGDPRYLTQALMYVNNAMGSARMSADLGPAAFGDSYLGWTSYSTGLAGAEVPLYESYLWRYIMRLLYAFKLSPMFCDEDYRDQYRRILAFAETNIFDKWFYRGVNSYIYRQNTHMAAHWAYIATFLALLTPDPARACRAAAVADNISHHIPSRNGASLHGQMQPSPVNAAAYWWDEDFGFSARPGQDVAHGNGVISYVVAAHDVSAGGWTLADITALSVTLDAVIWPGTGTCAAYVDGSGSGSCWFPDGWVKLGRYDPGLQRRIEGLTVARGAQLYGNGALNAARLGVPE